MREILFRGKTLDCGRWIEGDLRHWPSGSVGICDRATNKTIKVDPETVGQYTGERNMEGQQIYEGDLVRAILPATDYRAGFEWPVAAVVYKNGVFGFEDRHGGITPLSGYAHSIRFEIIGNLHDNPEKVKEG